MAAKLLNSGKILNIEVGDKLTKVCLSARHGKSYQILDSFIFQTPEKSVSDGQIADPEKLASELITRETLLDSNIRQLFDFPPRKTEA